MKNGDLKRFYPDTKIDKKDFVRYDDNKNIKVGTPSSNDDAMSKAATQAAIEHAQLSIYKPGGSKTFAQLPTPGESYLGYVYNVTDAFTTDSRFIEGAGKKFPAGTDVAVIIDGEDYYYNVWVGGQDYDLLANIPIINQDLDDAQFTPQSGKYYRHIAGPAVGPTFQPFTVGDTLSNGDKIHFDTTKGDELATYLEGLTYDSQGQYKLVDFGDNNSLNAAGMDGDYLVILVIGEATIPFYSTTNIPDFAVIGFNNLDESGDYTLSLSEDKIIVTINDTNPPTWNGIIIGQMEEAPASSFVDGKIYYYDGQYNAIPGAASVTAANINSGDATNGQALIADGLGGAHWGDVAGSTLNKYYFSTNQYTSANIARLGHILNNGIFIGGVATIGNEIPVVFKISDSSQSSLVLSGVYIHSDNETRIATVTINTAYETVTYRMVIISSTGTVTVSTGGSMSGRITLAYLAESEITA